ncbi:MAG: MBL fold metallo-hydrolase [Burkholderiaceae bacterium]|nr:MBL fold metallo-hydrolase [Burkholderiaceae bacterium]
MQLKFQGAAGEVTGSQVIVDVSTRRQHRRFLVDCGMFQGGRDADAKNLSPFGTAPKSIEFVVLTHAHIDHSGLLPRLCAQGFTGPIYCTAGTLDLLEVLLADSAHIQEFERRRAEDRLAAGRWRGDLPEPLYNLEDVGRCISQCRPIGFHRPTELTPGIRLSFVDAGHILGSASALLEIEEDQKEHAKPVTRRLVFSGDVGTRDRPIMNDPQRLQQADILVMESTYGDRRHRSLKETEDELVGIITHTMKSGGNVVMPAFAVGRTQEVVAILIDLIKRKRLPHLSIFVDSPMAAAASRITEAHMATLDPLSRELYAWAKANPNAVSLRYLTKVEESKGLNQIRGGAIILSASGMCEAGRIVHHLFWNLPSPQSAIVITGFQAAGTRGRALVDGARAVKLLGREVPVKAAVHTLGGLSAHGDQQDLLWWCGDFERPPAQVFVTHGEENAAATFAQCLKEKLGWEDVHLAERGKVYHC